MPTNRLVEKEKVTVYANTLLEAATAQGRETALEIRDELEQVVASVRGNAKLSETLKDSTIPAAKRAEIMRAVFAACNPILVEVLGVVVDREDAGLLGRIAAAYESQLSSALNVTIVDITTVVELDDHLREVITKKAIADFGTDVVLREHIDTTMLGGILMSANGKRLNASMRWQLENARTALKKTV